MFAKLFETGVGQILVKMDTNDDGDPEVRLYFEPNGLGVCSVAASFDDNDEGWDSQEKYFASVDESKAYKKVKEVIGVIPT